MVDKGGVSSARGRCLQDVMRLDNTARMNTPGVAAGNWRWRIGDEGVWERLRKEAEDLKALGYRSARTPAQAVVPKQ